MHGVSADADRGKLAVALGLILAFMAVAVTVGVHASSLALLSDAAHMLTDATAIGLSLVAIRLAQRPAKGAMTFGLKRTEILSAQFNATLLVLGLLIVYEGISRLITPPNLVGTAVLIVGLLGIVVNLAATWTLSKANRQSMNVEGAYQHILTTLIAFIVTAIAGAVILITEFDRADGIASLVFSQGRHAPPPRSSSTNWNMTATSRPRGVSQMISTRSSCTCTARSDTANTGVNQPPRTVARRSPPAHEGNGPLPRRDQLPLARLGAARPVLQPRQRRRDVTDVDREHLYRIKYQQAHPDTLDEEVTAA